MLCTSCIHNEVCEGLFPADQQECEHYHGTCDDCEYLDNERHKYMGWCVLNETYKMPDEYCSKWEEKC